MSFVKNFLQNVNLKIEALERTKTVSEEKIHN